MNTTMDKQHEIVKGSLFKFISSHITGVNLSAIDEIVLSYVISILEEMSSPDQIFDSDDFIEMMIGYFPELNAIASSKICDWLFQVERELVNLKKGSKVDILMRDLRLIDMIPESKLCNPRTVSVSEVTGSDLPVIITDSSKQVVREQHLSENSDCGSTDSTGNDFFSDECEMLQELFPEAAFLEIKHCITIANGDIDRAIQIFLDREEAGQSLTNSNISNLHAPKCQRIDDNELKNRIISRYSYVDKNAEAKEHRPVVPKLEPKKLVRYRDNKIVSLRGERYTEVRRDDETAELKKPKKAIYP